MKARTTVMLALLLSGALSCSSPVEPLMTAISYRTTQSAYRLPTDGWPDSIRTEITNIGSDTVALFTCSGPFEDLQVYRGGKWKDVYGTPFDCLPMDIAVPPGQTLRSGIEIWADGGLDPGLYRLRIVHFLVKDQHFIRSYSNPFWILK